MADVVRLNDDEVRSRMAPLPGWELRDGALHRELRFGTFADAFSFMTSVAFAAERMNHHPDWSNVYNRVTIRLSTHDVAGISEHDLTLAGEISAAYQRFSS
ncbi:MAG TPA: 4a-hydroxytetrahydrobiopterin dehydratase [Thermoanaerobaculia bacterium]